MGDFPKIISVDDHVIEPPNVWQDRLPAKYKDYSMARAKEDVQKVYEESK